MDSKELKARYAAGERNFKGVSLRGANLAWIDLQGVDLRGADLSDVNLSNANLSEANLSEGTSFAFADLSRAILCNANLQGTIFEGANLAGIELDGSFYNEHTKFPTGFDPLSAGAVSPNKTQQPQKRPTESVKVQQLPSDKPQIQEKKLSPLPKEMQPHLQTSNASNARDSNDVAPLNQMTENLKQRVDAIRDSLDTLAQSELFTNSSGQAQKSVVPAEIAGWNWGACLLPWFWITTNKVWGGLWIWFVWMVPGLGQSIMLLSMIVFGAKGNEWAWKNRHWQSVAAFKKHQRYWAIAGFILWGLYLWNIFSSRR